MVQVRSVPLYKDVGESGGGGVERKSEVLRSRAAMAECVEKLAAAGLEGRIAFIGGGNMTQALVGGFLKSAILPAENIGVSNPSQAKLAAMATAGVRCYSDTSALLRDFKGGIIFLSVKPHILPAVLKLHRAAVLESKLVLSLAAGVSMDGILRMLEDSRNDAGLPLIRVMPTIAATVQASPTGVVTNKYTTPEIQAVVRCLLETVGSCHFLPEYQLDAFNGLISPGHVFTFLDAMSDGAVKMGLPRDLSLRVAAETMAGAAKLALDTGRHPGELKNMVTSPGGTTIAGIHALENGGVRAAIIHGIEASVNRSRELDQIAKTKN